MAIVRKNMLSGLIGPLVFSVVRNQQRVTRPKISLQFFTFDPAIDLQQ